MAEEYVLVPKSKYEQLLPNGPPPTPSQLVSVTRPPPGLPAGDPLAQNGKVISRDKAEAKVQLAKGAYDNSGYLTDSDSESDDNGTSVKAPSAKRAKASWKEAWQSL